MRDRLVTALTDWMALLTRLVTEAVAAGHLRPETDAAALAYEIESLGVCAVVQAPVLGPVTFRRARLACQQRLRTLATDPSTLELEPT